MFTKILVAIALLFAVHHAPTTDTVPPPVPDPVTVAPVTFAAVGDSITAWVDRNGVDVSDRSWTIYAAPAEFSGQGWAKGGAKLAEMADMMTPTQTDWLVIMAGTNDLGTTWGTPVADRFASLQTIVSKSGANHVVLAAVAPRDDHPEWSDAWNTQLQAFATQQGWFYMDPWQGVRQADGRYGAGQTIEGIHPTAATAAIVGGQVGAWLARINFGGKVMS